MIKIEDKTEYKNENIIELTGLIFEECGIGEGEFEINDWDCDRIYVSGEGREWIIRTWNIRENNKGKTIIDWTLYLMRQDRSAAEKSLGNGKTVM